MRGQDSHETMRSGPSRVTGIGEAKPHRKAFPGGRQVRGKTRPVDQSAGQTAPGALRRQPTSRPIGVRVRPPGNWRLSSDYPSGGHSREEVRGSRSRR